MDGEQGAKLPALAQTPSSRHTRQSTGEGRERAGGDLDCKLIHLKQATGVQGDAHKRLAELGRAGRTELPKAAHGFQLNG